MNRPRSDRRLAHRERTRFDGAIFDVDGVLVDSPHERAWRETLQDLMETRWENIRPESTWTPDRFTSQVYQEVIAGKPRDSGALAALQHFAVPDAASRVNEYATRKQQRVIELIEAGEFGAFPDAVRLLLDAHEAGIRVAAASSSKNTGLMLGRLRLDSLADEHDMRYDFIKPRQTLLDLLDVDISGRSFKQGKPHPEIFLTACRELGIAPWACLVVEDAVAGVTAAKTGGMAALGIARSDDVQVLRDAGADLVVTTLDDIDRSALRDGHLIRVAGVAT
ncbi:MAG: HAD family hydrolase [Solirubrobacteraceae bacterium]